MAKLIINFYYYNEANFDIAALLMDILVYFKLLQEVNKQYNAVFFRDKII